MMNEKEVEWEAQKGNLSKINEELSIRVETAVAGKLEVQDQLLKIPSLLQEAMKEAKKEKETSIENLRKLEQEKKALNTRLDRETKKAANSEDIHQNKMAGMVKLLDERNIEISSRKMKEHNSKL